MNFWRNLKRKIRRFEKASDFEKRHSKLKKELLELHKAKQKIKEQEKKTQKELEKGRRL